MRAILPLLLLAGCDGDDKPKPTPSPVIEQPQPAKTDWQIGPWRGKINDSKNCPLHPTASNGSFHFDIGPCEPHYVTKPTGSLANAKQIRARFKVEGEGIIHGAKCSSPSAVTLHFSLPYTGRDNGGVNWSNDGGRWWASFATHPLSGAGEFEITAPLDGPWTSVLAMTAENNPQRFAEDKANAGRVGFTFRSCTGLGHGAAATEPMRFTVLEYRIE